MESKKRMHFLVNAEMKKNWIMKAKEQDLSLTDFIINKVEDNLTRNQALFLSQKVDEIAKLNKKVDTNINQVTKIINAEKRITEKNIVLFNQYFSEYIEKINEQNKEIKKFHKLIFSL